MEDVKHVDQFPMAVQEQIYALIRKIEERIAKEHRAAANREK